MPTHNRTRRVVQLTQHMSPSIHRHTRPTTSRLTRRSIQPMILRTSNRVHQCLRHHQVSRRPQRRPKRRQRVPRFNLRLKVQLRIIIRRMHRNLRLLRAQTNRHPSRLTHVRLSTRSINKRTYCTNKQCHRQVTLYNISTSHTTTNSIVQRQGIKQFSSSMPIRTQRQTKQIFTHMVVDKLLRIHFSIFSLTPVRSREKWSRRGAAGTPPR